MTLAAVTLAVCVSALILGFLYRRQMKQYQNLNLAGVERYLQMLLKRGFNGGFLILEGMNSREPFVQFRKYIEPGGRIGIECHFPKAAWSSDYYDKVQQLSARDQLDSSVVIGSGDHVSVFLRIDFGADVELASHFAERVFTEVFGFPDLSVRVRSDGINPRDELVDH